MIKIIIDQLIRERAAEWHRNITYADVTEATGISDSTLARLKLGRARGIQWRVLEPLCIYLDCQPGDLIVLEPGVPISESDADRAVREARERGLGIADLIEAPGR
jgi:putative transcriptional regulator